MKVADIEALGFAKTHELVVEEERLRFIGASCDENAGVYVWVSGRNRSEEIEIVYVGKAGYGVSRRLRQHEGGFVNSRTGRKNAQALQEIVAGGGVLEVYARPSATAELFGQTVSLYAAEEDALCSLFAPRLNRMSFPRVGQAEEASTDTAVERPDDFLASRFAEHRAEARDDFEAQWESMSRKARTTVLQLVAELKRRVLEPNHRVKLVRSFTNQPNGCSGVPLLNFGALGTNGNMRPNGWVARITLTEEPRLILPEARFAPLRRDDVDFGERGFSPKSTAAFLERPADYLTDPVHADPGHARGAR